MGQGPCKSFPVNQYDTTEDMDEKAIIISREQRSATFKSPSLAKLVPNPPKEEPQSIISKITSFFRKPTLNSDAQACDVQDEEEDMIPRQLSLVETQQKC
mmetsp:Transcript_8004/g.7503  ORF Transcript_8004/g.7503 Transcript_8004/m.7503 type:complete len:100 (-) Transcript_8004:1314-1613(-)